MHEAFAFARNVNSAHEYITAYMSTTKEKTNAKKQFKKQIKVMSQLGFSYNELLQLLEESGIKEMTGV